MRKNWSQWRESSLTSYRYNSPRVSAETNAVGEVIDLTVAPVPKPQLWYWNKTDS